MGPAQLASHIFDHVDNSNQANGYVPADGKRAISVGIVPVTKLSKKEIIAVREHKVAI